MHCRINYMNKMIYNDDAMNNDKNGQPSMAHTSVVTCHSTVGTSQCILSLAFSQTYASIIKHQQHTVVSTASAAMQVYHYIKIVHQQPASDLRTEKKRTKQSLKIN